MMKTAFKVFSLLGVLSLVAPMAVSAATPEERGVARTERMEERQENREAKKEEVKDKRQEAFCDRFSEHAATLAAGVKERREAFEDRKDTREGKMEESRDGRDAKLEDKRSDADQRRSEMYQKLEGKADTAAEKEAVSDFKDAIEKAVDTRQEAVDQVLEAFRTGVDAVIAGRKDDMEGAVSTFDAAVSAAVAKAKSDCEGGSDPGTVRSGFRTALEAARASLKEDRTDSEKIKTQVKALAETRRVAIKKAVDDFKTAAQAAKDDLQKAFGEEAGA